MAAPVVMVAAAIKPPVAGGLVWVLGAFTAVLSVYVVGIFKPHPSVYQLAMDRLGVTASAVSFQSSNAWDAAAAAAFGFRVAWINRFGQAQERLPGTPDAELRRLDELPPLLGL